MTTPATIQDAIEATAKGPASATLGEGTQSKTAQSIRDQILADQYLGSKSAASSSHIGIRFRQIVPPAAG